MRSTIALDLSESFIAVRVEGMEEPGNNGVKAELRAGRPRDSLS